MLPCRAAATAIASKIDDSLFAAARSVYTETGISREVESFQKEARERRAAG